jgi:hypothetical protein
MKRFLSALTVVAFCAAPLVAQADWDWEPDNPRDKWIQMPDPYGWDVKVTSPKILADDFLCTDPLPITDIHFWGSWEGDVVGQITSIHLSIHDDLPGAYPSQPKDPPIWEKDVDESEFTIRQWWEEGDQGWYDPNTGYYHQYDHTKIYQVNILMDRSQWFWQEGTETDPIVYWLDIQVTVADPINTDFGWKTSLEHWRDDAVWKDEGSTVWQKLVDPITQETLDMAFVITTIPEPSVFVLAGVGLLALLRLRKR